MATLVPMGDGAVRLGLFWALFTSGDHMSGNRGDARLDLVFWGGNAKLTVSMVI